MKFLAPETIVPVMDAISEGWQFGPAVENVQLERWEDHIDEPLVDLRVRFGIDPEGRKPLVR